MSIENELGLLEASISQGSVSGIEWEDYAAQFDRMCEVLPTYEDNIELLASHIASFDLPAKPVVLDVGAGTGNFIARIAPSMPAAEFVHLDASSAMNERAEAKYRKRGIENVRVVRQHIQSFQFPEASADLVICVNVLFDNPPHRVLLDKMKSWLKPGGVLFVIDFGRPQRVFDWSWYIFRNTLRNHGFARVLRVIMENRAAMKTNRQAVSRQRLGKAWLHSTEEFVEALQSVGLSVVSSQTCYRGYCDLAICRKV